LKNVFNIGGKILAVVSVLYLFAALKAHASELPPIHVDSLTIAGIGLSISYLICVQWITALAWIRLLRGANIVVSLKQAYVFMGKSQIAKYLPGNVFHYVSRVGLGMQAGLAAESLVLSIGVETALIAVAAGMVGSTMLIFSGARLKMFTNLEVPYYGYIVIGAILFLLLIIMIGSKRVRNWLLERKGYLNIRQLEIAFGMYLLIYVIIGVFIAYLVETAWQVHVAVSWYTFSCVFALSWVLGFIVPGAPGGIGIREAVFVGLLSNDIGEGLAVGLAILLRVITSVSDLITFGIAYYLGRVKNSTQTG
jgi:uncharacterized membrane protein YbhN (UPF0104 family)